MNKNQTLNQPRQPTISVDITKLIELKPHKLGKFKGVCKYFIIESEYKEDIFVSKNRGVYALYNKIEDKYYIGETLKYFSERKTHHFQLLKNKNHPNKNLQCAYDKFGEESFVFIIVKICNNNIDNRLKIEENLINYYSNIGKCYNIIGTNEFGKMRCGERNPKAKISDAKAEEIYLKYYLGDISKAKLSKIYNVSTTIIDGITNYKTFKHLNLELKYKSTVSEYVKNKINMIEKVFIEYYSNKKNTIRLLANKYNISQSMVINITSKENYKNLNLMKKYKELITKYKNNKKERR